MIYKKYLLIFSGTLFFPKLLFAAPQNFKAAIGIIVDLTQIAVPIVAGLALLVFIWGLAKFILAAGGDEKAVSDGKNLMLWGIVSLFVMFSIWGIIRLFFNDFFIDAPYSIPLLPQSL